MKCDLDGCKGTSIHYYRMESQNPVNQSGLISMIRTEFYQARCHQHTQSAYWSYHSMNGASSVGQEIAEDEYIVAQIMMC